jgi:hypothetical protein
MRNSAPGSRQPQGQDGQRLVAGPGDRAVGKKDHSSHRGLTFAAPSAQVWRRPERTHQWIASGWLQPDATSARLLSDLPRNATILQDDPADSVLNGFNRWHEVDNLYVVDGSFLPTSSGSNPSPTIAANALRVGDHLAAVH